MVSRCLLLTALIAVSFTSSAQAADFAGSTLVRNGNAETDSGSLVKLSTADGAVRTFSGEFDSTCFSGPYKKNGKAIEGTYAYSGSGAVINADGTSAFPVAGTTAEGDTFTGQVELDNVREDSQAVTGTLRGTFGIPDCDVDAQLLLPAVVADTFAPGEREFSISANETTLEFDASETAVSNVRLRFAGGCTFEEYFEWSSASRGAEPITVGADGRFSFSGVDVVDATSRPDLNPLIQGTAVAFTVSGRVDDDVVTGRLRVDNQAISSVCADDQLEFRAGNTADPYLREVPEPSVVASVFAVRKKVGGRYRHGFGAFNIRCTDTATHYELRVGKKKKRVACGRKHSRPADWLLGIKPGKRYTVVLTPFRKTSDGAFLAGIPYPREKRLPLAWRPYWDKPDYKNPYLVDRK